MRFGRAQADSVGLVGLFLGAAACSAAGPPARAPAAESGAAAPAEARQRKGEGPTLPPGRDVSLRGELAAVERVRALSALRAVRGRSVTSEALVAHVEAGFRRELPPSALEGTEDMLVGLGVVPLDFDFEAAMLRLLRAELAGLYDPELEAMLLREELSGEERDAALYHELVHALQDQHYDLDELAAWRDDASDGSSAVSCLAEGDATSAMLDALLAASGEQSGAPARTALDLPDALLATQLALAAAGRPEEGIPPIVRRSLLAPYADGLAFVQRLRRRGGWAEVDAAWQRRPTTTEQILHLDKYLAGEPGLAVEPAPPPSDDFARAMTDVWGEQSLRLVLEEWLPPITAATSAAGWGGDRIAVYRAGERRAVAWHMVGDAKSDAERLLAAFRRRPGQQRALEVAGADEPGACFERGGAGPLALARRGAHTLLVAGPLDRTGAPLSGVDCASAGAWLERSLSALEP